MVISPLVCLYDVFVQNYVCCVFILFQSEKSWTIATVMLIPGLYLKAITQVVAKRYWFYRLH